jgi:cation diffusion facilitator family transporter
MAVRYADRPADDDHPFGHAKMESVAALVETGLLCLVTGWIIYESALRLIWGGHAVEVNPLVLAIVAASIIIDWNRSRALQRVADKTSSDALAADALHFRADMWSSVAVLIGLLCTKFFNAPWADSLAALIVAFFVGHAAIGLGRSTLATLLDAAPEGLTASVKAIAADVPGVLAVRQARLRPAGPTTFVNLTLDVPRTLSAPALATLLEETRKRIADAVPNADIALTTESVQLDDESAHDKIMHIATEHKAAIHHITVQDNDGRLAVSFDFEVDGATQLLQAHDAATALETAIRAGLGSDVEVESHIEPRPPMLLQGKLPPKGEVTLIESALAALVKKEKSLSDLHNIRIRRTEAGLFIHYHCRCAPQTTVLDVHSAIDRVENALTAKIKGIARVVAHAEPVGIPKHKL